jgi:NarL family two-component system sensor histidine kinase YdfH
MQHIQRSLQKISLFRWVVFLWIGLAYLWGVQWANVMQERVHASHVLPFTLIMLLYFSVYSASVFLPVASEWYRLLYVAIQALLILLVSLVSSRFGIVVALYIALCAEMVSLLLKIRMALLAAAACLVLVSFSLSLGQLSGWDSMLIILTHIVLPYVLPFCLFVVGYAALFRRQARAYAQTRTLLHELESAHRQLADYAVRIEELTRTAERQRLAREFHDTLAQGLAGLILQLEAVKSHLVNRHHERALSIVTQAMGQARTSLAAARCAIDDLRGGAVTPANLGEVLEDEIERFTAATGIPCTTHLSFLSTLPDAFCESVARSVAEGLMNVARHAQACQVWVCVAEKDELLVIEVRDDGVGFEPTVISRQGHYGLIGLRERARLLGGQLTVMSAPGKGTSMRVLLPVTRGEDLS